MFAGTTATIVSGAMAERTKFSAYLVYSGIVSLVVYPARPPGLGQPAGRGHRQRRLAGQRVHRLRGLDGGALHRRLASPSPAPWSWAPCLGKYGGLDGKPRAILGHNLPMPSACSSSGSAGSASTRAAPTWRTKSIGRIAVTTNFAAATGTCSAPSSPCGSCSRSRR
ncbi:MAG: hypothetical protein U1G05_19915 [Kiritimatiellia bacterium]